jgi:hypothetical protein
MYLARSFNSLATILLFGFWSCRTLIAEPESLFTRHGWQSSERFGLTKGRMPYPYYKREEILNNSRNLRFRHLFEPFDIPFSFPSYFTNERGRQIATRGSALTKSLYQQAFQPPPLPRQICHQISHFEVRVLSGKCFNFDVNWLL